MVQIASLSPVPPEETRIPHPLQPVPLRTLKRAEARSGQGLPAAIPRRHTVDRNPFDLEPRAWIKRRNPQIEIVSEKVCVSSGLLDK